MSRLIQRIVKQKPDISEKELQRELRKLEEIETDGVTIERIGDVTIEWRDAKKPDGASPISGLKDRLTRTRKLSDQT